MSISICNTQSQFKIPEENHNPTVGNCLHTCLKYPIGYHCVCLNVDIDKTGQHSFSEYLKNTSLSVIGYKPIQMVHQINLNADILEVIGNTTFDYNLRTQKIYYYDAILQQIRYV